MANASAIKVSSELLGQLQQSTSLKGTSVDDELREFLTIRSEKKKLPCPEFAPGTERCRT